MNLIRDGGGGPFRPEHVARNPVQQVPVLAVEGDGKQVHLAQSMAIVATSTSVTLIRRSSGLALLRARARHIAETVRHRAAPAPYPTLVRVGAACAEVDAFQRAEGARQPDAPPPP